MRTFETVSQFSRMLKNLDQWLHAGVAYAQKRNFDPDVLVHARLAPDQYALVRQVQSGCDTAKFTAAYLAEQKAPPHPDTEKTITELRARIQACVAFLDAFKVADFGGAEERRVAPPWMQGKSVRGDHYLMRIAVPNFYFHVTTAYAILRHNGVDLGKLDFIGVRNWTDCAEW